MHRLYINYVIVLESEGRRMMKSIKRTKVHLIFHIHLHQPSLLHHTGLTMESLPDALPLTPISSMLAGIDPNEFDDPIFSDDESSRLSSAPNTLMTPSFGTGPGSAESSASDTSATTGSTIYKRQKIKRKSYVFNAANGVKYISKEGKQCWRCMHCIILLLASVLYTPY
jgi:hypothetical protein